MYPTNRTGTKSKGKEHKQKHTNGTINIFSKGYTTEGSRNYNQNSSNSLENEAVCKSLDSGKFLEYRVSSWQLQIFERQGIQLQEQWVADKAVLKLLVLFFTIFCSTTFQLNIFFPINVLLLLFFYHCFCVSVLAASYYIF